MTVLIGTDHHTTNAFDASQPTDYAYYNRCNLWLTVLRAVLNAKWGRSQSSGSLLAASRVCVASRY
jgi:hypothetical protein